MTILSVAILMIIGLTWVRLWRPGASRLQGATILVERLTLLARLRMHAVPSGLVLLVSVFAVSTGRAPVNLLVVAAISSVLLVIVPVRYTLTEQGIRLGYTGFRRWTEFTGVRRAPGGAKLLGLQRKPGMRIWLSGDRRDDEFLQFLRQTVKNAYKGTSGVIPFPTERVMLSVPETDNDHPMVAQG